MSILPTLLIRRSDLTKEVETLHGRLQQLIYDIQSMDATIKLFDTSYQNDGLKPKAFRPPDDWSHHNQMARSIIDILRRATEPMTSRDISMELLLAKGLNAGDRKLLRVMVSRVGASLNAQRVKGIVRSTQGTGQYLLWEVVRMDDIIPSSPE